MARGNDAEAAAAEMQSQYGDAPNAEELIAAHRAAQDPRLHRASLSRIDQGATDALDLSSFDVGEGEEVVAASVRGVHVIAVVEDARGNYSKRLMAVPESAKKKSTANKVSEGPKQATQGGEVNNPPGGDPESAEDQQKRAQQAEKEAAEGASDQAKASGSGPDAAAAAEKASSRSTRR